jgi:hypothetical protein
MFRLRDIFLFKKPLSDSRINLEILNKPLPSSKFHIMSCFRIRICNQIKLSSLC